MPRWWPAPAIAKASGLGSRAACEGEQARLSEPTARLSLSLSLLSRGAGRSLTEGGLEHSSVFISPPFFFSHYCQCLLLAWDLGASAALGSEFSKRTDCSFDFDLFLLNRTFRCFFSSVCLSVCLRVCSFRFGQLPQTDRQTAKKAGSPVLLLLRLLPAGSVGHELLSFVRVLFCCYQ